MKLLGRLGLGAVITVFACVAVLNVWVLSGGGGGSPTGGDQLQQPDLQRRSALLSEVVHRLERRVAELQVRVPTSFVACGFRPLPTCTSLFPGRKTQQ